MITRLATKQGWLLFRIIIPAYPRVNIYTRPAAMTTALGPIMIATMVNKFAGKWRVEVIDENNYHGPRDKDGLPDHAALQRENPADVVGFYCGITCTIERVWQLAEFYQGQGVYTIAGGWHAFDCVEETLEHNIDIVVHGKGDMVICQILESLRERGFLENIPGISFLKNGEIITNPSTAIKEEGLSEFLTNLPYPDFGLLRYAKLDIYPIQLGRGCKYNCEHCRVNEENPYWADPKHLFNIVNWLVETRGASKFFIVDDGLGSYLEPALEFFRLIAEKYGNKLWFMIQISLEVAKNKGALDIMKKAGVSRVSIGFESPIDEELKAMRKGRSSSRVLEYTNIWRRYFRVHGMFMVGYPQKDRGSVDAKETVRRFKRFIRKARLDSVQVLITGPLQSTPLRERLEREKRIFPLEVAPWSLYDGQFVLFEPDNMSAEELQKIPLKIMRWFYPFNLIRLCWRAISFHRFIKGKRNYLDALSTEKIRYTANRFIKRWLRDGEAERLVERIKEYKQKSS